MKVGSVDRFSEIAATDWARLAAFIDGEGCISIAKQKKAAFGRRQFILILHLGNTDPRLVLWISKTFGVGRIQLRTQTNPKWKNLHYWQVAGKTAAALLEACMPYLILKKEQANLGLAFMTLVKRGGDKKGLSLANYSAREQYHEQLGDLKKKVISISEVA